MRLDLGNRIAVLGMEACLCAIREAGSPLRPGHEAGRRPCPKCRGTRRGPRGGRNRCGCFDGTVADFENQVVCGACRGLLQVPETPNCYLGTDLWREFLDATPVRILLVGREPSWNEAWLGYGCVRTMVDYGRAWDWMQRDRAGAEAELLRELRRETHPRLSDISRPMPAGAEVVASDLDLPVDDSNGDGNPDQQVGGEPDLDRQRQLCLSLVLTVTRGGYNVRARFTPESAAVDAGAGEPPERQGLAVGQRALLRGQNGTLAAAGLIPEVA